MIKLLFGVAVSVLLIVLAANLVVFLMPVLTHPIVFTVWFGFVLIVGYKLIFRSAK
jgi:predicted tellurium resistance membrane protein TerC